MHLEFNPDFRRECRNCPSQNQCTCLGEAHPLAWLTRQVILPIDIFWTPKTFSPYPYWNSTKVRTCQGSKPGCCNYTPQPLRMPLPSPSYFWQPSSSAGALKVNATVQRYRRKYRVLHFETPSYAAYTTGYSTPTKSNSKSSPGLRKRSGNTDGRLSVAM